MTPSDASIEPGAIETFAVTMVSRLRELGLTVPVAATVAYTAALAEVDTGRRASVYWAGRATLVHRPEDTEPYDRVFAMAFSASSPGDGPTDAEPSMRPVTLTVDDPAADGREEGDGDIAVPDGARRWTEREVLRSRDFARCSPDELAEVHRLIADLRVASVVKPSRRRRPTRRTRGQLDVRKTAQRSLRTGGETVRTHHRAASERPRRLVLLCDVSGSMELYSRALVRFAHAAVAGRTQVEAFTLGTRCTRITRALRTRDPDAALAAAAAAVEDWSSGTRLGDGLRVFNDTWGQRGMARGALVVVLSDGWDRGDPAVLAEQTARIQRNSHRLVWVNPLKATPDFSPTAQGMAAALPFVDELVEGHSLGSLEALAKVIAR